MKYSHCLPTMRKMKDVIVCFRQKRRILRMFIHKKSSQREFVLLTGHGVLEEIAVSKSVVLEKC